MRPLNSQFKRQQTHTQDLQKQHSLEDSIRDYRKVYPELTDQQLASLYQRRYGVPAGGVLRTLAKLNQPTGGKPA